jgi:hypothetical protein
VKHDLNKLKRRNWIQLVKDRKIPKPGKPPHEAASYRPISLLHVMSKLFEKLLIKRLKLIIERKNLILNHQFGFQRKRSTIDQVHRITNIIENAVEEKKVCSAGFLDLAQAFDKLWHKGLNCKLRTVLPKQYAELSYPSNTQNCPTQAIRRTPGIIFSR